MERADWVIGKAAPLLGMSYKTLQYRLEKFAIERPDRRRKNHHGVKRHKAWPASTAHPQRDASVRHHMGRRFPLHGEPAFKNGGTTADSCSMQSMFRRGKTAGVATQFIQRAGRRPDTMKILILGRDYFSLATDPDHTTQVISQPDALTLHPPPTLQSLISQHRPGFSPDLVLHTDESKLPTVTGLAELHVPLFGFFIDSHIHYGWHREFAGIFDHIFVAQKDCCDSINRHTANCSWLPLFAAPDAGEGEELLHEVSFVGTLDRSLNPERVRFIQSLGRLVPLTLHSGAFSRIFRQSKIVLNQSVKTDINFRVFETLASGSLLLTDNTGNGMDELLEEGIHFVGYRKNDPEDAADRIRYYLEHEEERRAIARAGYEALRERHSTGVRRRQLMNAVTSLTSQWGGRDPQKPGHARSYGAARTNLNVARLAADLKRECGIEIAGGRDYADLAEACLLRVNNHSKIEFLVRDPLKSFDKIVTVHGEPVGSLSPCKYRPSTGSGRTDNCSCIYGTLY